MVKDSGEDLKGKVDIKPYNGDDRTSCAFMTLFFSNAWSKSDVPQDIPKDVVEAQKQVSSLADQAGIGASIQSEDKVHKGLHEGVGGKESHHMHFSVDFEQGAVFAGMLSPTLFGTRQPADKLIDRLEDACEASFAARHNINPSGGYVDRAKSDPNERY